MRHSRRHRPCAPGRRTAGLLCRAALESLEPRILCTNVLTYHNDLTRQGWNPAETALTPVNVNQNAFGRLFSYPVQGQVYAQPLYVSNLTIPGLGTHNVVFVATQHNDVYAFDADSPAGPNGGLIWHVNLGPSAATPSPYFANRYGPYHDINPEVGITSTPVIDLATNTIYLDAFTNDTPGQNAFSHHIWSLDITTGAQKAAPALVAATIPGTSPGSINGTLTFSAAQQLQRSALTLFNGTLYAEYTGYADTNPYNGWILGFNPASLQLQTVFNTTPTLDTDPSVEAGEGGIWQSGNGLSSDGSKLYIMIANGDFNPAASSMDWGDSFLQLSQTNPASPDRNGYGLSVTDYFTPYNEQALADADSDLGSGGTLLLPDQTGAHPHLIVGAGKQGMLYVVDRDSMGHFNATGNSVVQTLTLGGGVFGTPAFFNNTLYVHPGGTTLKAFTITNGTFSAVANATGGFSYGGGPTGTSTPSISSNGNANGIVWEIQNSGTSSGLTSAHAILRAYNATPNGSTLTEIYNSDQAGARDRMGKGVKFTVPTIADGKVFVGADDFINIFGLLSTPTDPPSAPVNLAASNATANQILLSWTDTATTETGFKIERSTDGINFTQVTVASANAISFADTSVTPGIDYTYRVRATNTIGDSAFSNTAEAIAVGVSIPRSLYPFEEGTGGAGTITADTTDSNPGTLVGSNPPQWVPGRIGNSALSFLGNGTTSTLVSAVQTSVNLGVTLGTTSSLSAWIKTTQVGNNSPFAAPAITGAERAGSSADIRWGYLDATGHIGVSAGNNTGAKSTTIVNDGNWHHVAFTRNASTGTTQVYVDGNLEATASGDTGTKDAVFRLIGGQSNVNANDGATLTSVTWFNGQIDDLRIFNQVLSASEVAALGKVPSAPTNLAVTPVSGSIDQLTWNNVSAFAQNIEIDRRAGTSGAFTQVALLSGSTTLYNDVNLTAGTQYFYRIRAIDLAGASPFTAEVSATPPRPVIIGRYTFYNESVFDGQNGSSNVTDDLAIANDKQPLLPGQTATFANYTSYSKGLNGVMLDLTNFENLPVAGDFSFLVGNSPDPSSWQAAAPPTYVTDYPGRGAGGSVRIVLVWPDNAIQNEWLQITVKNTGNFNLAAPDTFYFGNAIGDSGDSSADAKVTIVDALAPRTYPLASGAAVTNLYDYNRDGAVNAVDTQLAAATLTNVFNALILFSAPALPAALALPTIATTPATATPDDTSLPLLHTNEEGIPIVKPRPPSPGAISKDTDIFANAHPGRKEAVIHLTNVTALRAAKPMSSSLPLPAPRTVAVVPKSASLRDLDISSQLRSRLEE